MHGKKMAVGKAQGIIGMSASGWLYDDTELRKHESCRKVPIGIDF